MNKVPVKQAHNISDNFSLWDEIWDQYLYARYGEGEEYVENVVSYDLALQFHNILLEISKIFISTGHFRDKWDVQLEPKKELPPFNHTIILTSAKQQENYIFGLFWNKQFYLEVPIICPWNIKRMPDEFWKYFIELSQFGDFSVEEDALPILSDKDSSLDEAYLKGVKSNIYKMIWNYISWEQEYAEHYYSFGRFMVRWASNIKWEDLIQNGSKAFQGIYKMNHMLYKR
jgi:hypothetical protein